MKKSVFQERFYRDWHSAQDLHRLSVTAAETDMQIFTDKPPDKSFVEERLHSYRSDISGYINKDGRFLTALKPVSVEFSAPAIVQEMASAAKKVNVGPMAAVAGAIAEFLGRDLLRQGCRDVIVENGGDIFLKSSIARVVGIYSGSGFWENLGLKIKAQDTPLAICTSSGTVGHSLSFGLAEAAVALSENASLADAAATACANRVQRKEDLEGVLKFARSINGIQGAVIILKDSLISWGKIIEFTQ